MHHGWGNKANFSRRNRDHEIRSRQYRGREIRHHLRENRRSITFRSTGADSGYESIDYRPMTLSGPSITKIPCAVVTISFLASPVRRGLTTRGGRALHTRI